ncbi:MSHA biogenesis protein MshP [Vibrio ichthyoenteri ATCC 700023]|uniref:MSHA biogenesis protein MshP n=1 Tax=Vibrio ichthyoenteri ATCC 700023 TaxID=870968 RepID=F9S1I2_9VIBR|nr:hypothetical protein [Vibrio ichthyoenteri]EGU41688.1 MSHA biogenesis protein MshP [Vibrio ichthyoenteri ATCC 700023]
MFHSRSRQKGSLYIVVIFVLVVMGFLASTLSRIQWSNADAQTKEVLGTQAWLLAQSINEEALTIVYPLQTQSSAIATNCSTLEASALVDADDKFVNVENCKIVESSCTPSGTLAQVNYFKLIARVSCGSGKSVVERAEEIWVRE